MHKTIKQVVVNVSTSWIATLAQCAIGLYMVPFLLSHLGKDGYGVCTLIGVIVSTSGLVDLGLRGALRRQLSEKRAQNDRKGFQELAATAFAVYSVIAVLLICALLLSSKYLLVLFKVPDYLQEQALLLFRVTASMRILAAFVTPLFSASLACENRFDVTNNIQTVSTFFQAFVIIAVVSVASDPLYAWGWGAAGLTVVKIIMLALFAFKMSPWLSMSFFRAKRIYLKELFRLGGYMYTFQMANMLSVRANPVILTNAFGPASLAVYSPGSQLFERIRPFAQSLVYQLDPLTTRYHVQGRIKELQTSLTTGSRITMLMGFPFCVLLGVMSHSVIRVWLGESIGSDMQTAAWVLSAWAVIHFQKYCVGTLWSVLLGMDKVGFLVWLSLPSAIINILLSIFLVRYTSVGVLGVLIPTICLNMIVYPIAMLYTAKAVQLKLWSYFLQTHIPAILAVLPLAVLCTFLRLLYPTSEMFILLVQFSFCGLLYATCLYFIGLRKNERAGVRNKVSLIRKRMFG